MDTTASERKVQDLAYKYTNGEINGNDLADMMSRDELTKTERRKVMKLVKDEEKKKTLSKRQLLRLEVKEKKKLPKISREERKRKYHEELDMQREAEQAKFTICLGCRKRGHFLKDCPKLSPAMIAELQADKANVKMLCFNCGSTDHTLKSCLEVRDPSGYLPFAVCFICKRQGHLSRDCDENANGLYPKGGCCHICFQKTHLAKDCPQKPKPTEEESATNNLENDREEKKKEKGVIPGLTTIDDGNIGGDQIVIEDYEMNSEDDEDDAPKKKKRKVDNKKQKKDKKK